VDGFRTDGVESLLQDIKHHTMVQRDFLTCLVYDQAPVNPGAGG
jgi:hypothetical protein